MQWLSKRITCAPVVLCIHSSASIDWVFIALPLYNRSALQCTLDCVSQLIASLIGYYQQTHPFYFTIEFFTRILKLFQALFMSKL